MEFSAYRELFADLHESTFAGTNDRRYNQAYQNVIDTLDRSLSTNDIRLVVDDYLHFVSQKSEELPTWISDEIESQLLHIRNASNKLEVSFATNRPNIVTNDFEKLVETTKLKPEHRIEAIISQSETGETNPDVQSLHYLASEPLSLPETNQQQAQFAFDNGQELDADLDDSFSR